MTTPTQPGWYDDPQDSNAQRYWDGQDWTPHRRRKPISRPTSTDHASQPSPPVTPPQPSPPSTPPTSQPPGGERPQRSRSPKAILAVIAGVAVLAVAAVLVYVFVLPTRSSNPDSPQAACDALKDQSNTSAISWYQGRKAAGDSYRHIFSILTDANHKCPTTIRPQMTTIARQLVNDTLNDLRTHQQGGN